MKFRLVDQIIEFSRGTSIETRKVVSFEESSLLTTWGRRGSFPETLLLQFAVESSSLLIAFTTEFKEICVLKEILSCRFLGRTKPGDQLRGQIQVTGFEGINRTCNFQIYTEQDVISNGTFIVETTPIHCCFDPEEYALMWREMCDQTS